MLYQENHFDGAINVSLQLVMGQSRIILDSKWWMLLYLFEMFPRKGSNVQISAS